MAMPSGRVRDNTSEYGSVDVLSQDEFDEEFARNYTNSHLSALGPTRRGKTRRVKRMLKKVTSPDQKALVLHGKIRGRDSEIPEMSKDLNMRVISEYPPNYRPGDRKRSGYILVPLVKPTESAAEENTLLREQYKKAIHSSYQQRGKPMILVLDESHQVQETLKLKSEIEGPLMRGLPDCAEWNLIQRGRFVSYHCYDAPEHLIIFYDPDVSNQKRYSEIGGVDPTYLVYITRGLKTRTIHKNGQEATISEALYIRRGGPYLCIVSMD
jgi:hypothetical protein